MLTCGLLPIGPASCHTWTLKSASAPHSQPAAPLQHPAQPPSQPAEPCITIQASLSVSPLHSRSGLALKSQQRHALRDLAASGALPPPITIFRQLQCRPAPSSPSLPIPVSRPCMISMEATHHSCKECACLLRSMTSSDRAASLSIPMCALERASCELPTLQPHSLPT